MLPTLPLQCLLPKTQRPLQNLLKTRGVCTRNFFFCIACAASMPHFSHVTNRTQAKSEQGLAPFFTQVKHIVTETLPVQVMMGG